MGGSARSSTATWPGSRRWGNLAREEGPEVSPDSITIEATPRTKASANGAGSPERARKKRMLIIVL